MLQLHQHHQCSFRTINVFFLCTSGENPGIRCTLEEGYTINVGFSSIHTQCLFCVKVERILGYSSGIRRKEEESYKVRGGGEEAS